MNIKKPNSFARYGNDYVAPLTTIDQIVKPSGERYTDKEFELMSNVENVMFGENGCGKNLLNPTLQTTTINGVTCTNNGDGTFTLNGTATDTIYNFILGNITLDKGVYKGVGHPLAANTDYWLQFIDLNEASYTGGSNDESGNGTIITLNEKTTFKARVVVVSGATLDNVMIKPMITEDLSATYDDFEPYIKSLKQLTNSALNIDLLWTNASTTSAFAPQTINLDLSNYKLVLIDTYDHFLNRGRFLNVLLINSVFYIVSFYDFVYLRQVVVNEVGIEFGAGRRFEMTNDDNAYAVPYKIYGVK